MTSHRKKKEKRRIAKASRFGRYVVTRRKSRTRPGRKKTLKCPSCGNTMGQYHNHSLCNECQAKHTIENVMSLKEPKKMHIPSMSK